MWRSLLKEKNHSNFELCCRCICLMFVLLLVSDFVQCCIVCSTIIMSCVLYFTFYTSSYNDLLVIHHLITYSPHSQDNQQLVGDVKTGFPIPGDVEFEEYLGKQAKKAQKKAPVKVCVCVVCVYVCVEGGGGRVATCRTSNKNTELFSTLLATVLINSSCCKHI